MSTTVGDPKPRTKPASAPEREADRPATLRGRVDPVDPPDRLYRLTVEQYDKMARLGILTKDDKVELIEGLLVRKITIHDRHIWSIFFIDEGFRRVLPAGWFLYKENPIRLTRSEPEPDVAVLRGAFRDYIGRKPAANDVILAVEVAERSHADNRRKRSLYAEAGIPVYWIADLNHDRIEVYTDPTGPDPSPDYRNRRDYPIGEQVPLVIDGREVARLAVADLIAPRPEQAEEG